MVLFPMYFLKSFAYAGVAVVALAALAAIVVTPAAIALLGNDWTPSMFTGWYESAAAAGPVPRPVDQTFFYRLAKFGMRQAIPIRLAGAALLIALGLPFSSAKWGLPDDRVLPNRARRARSVISSAPISLTTWRRTSPSSSATPPISAPRRPTVTQASSRRCARSPVSSPDGTFVAGDRVGPPSAADRGQRRQPFLTVTSSAPLYSEASHTQLDGLADVPGPAGRHALLTGTAAINRDTAPPSPPGCL